MGVWAWTTIYFHKREELFPILETLFASGWIANNPFQFDQFSCHPPECDKKFYAELGGGDDAVVELPMQQLNRILRRIKKYDKSRHFRGQFVINLTIPHYDKRAEERESFYPIPFNMLLTGGLFGFSYSRKKPYLWCSWLINRLRANDQSWETDFAFYHEKLKPFLDAYQDKIKKVEAFEDW